MKKLLFCLVCFTVVVLFYACRKETPNVLYNQTIDHMKALARKENKSFCLILSNPNCPPCTDYVKILEDRFENLLGKVVFNIIDVSLPENQWYQQWICSTGMPTTCVFSQKGRLQAIVPGTAKHCLECVESSIRGDTDCADYLYSKHYKVSGDAISTLDCILDCKLKLDKGKNIEKEITASLSRIQYPYNFYIKCLAAQQNGNKEEASIWAKKILQFDNAYYYMLYKEIYSQARYIAAPDYDPSQIAVLTVEKETLLADCIIKQAKPFSVTVTNSGAMPLKIKDISLSCGCLKLLGDKQHNLLPGESKNIDFEFTADAEGNLYREITFVSNASNSVEIVKVTAIAK